MAEISSLNAIRYDFAALGGDVSSRVAPPYDVLDTPDKARLLERDSRNVVAIDLPYCPAKSLGPPECYDEAGRTLEAWLDDGTLVREAAPALYAYHQIFEYGGRSYTRKKFFTRLRLVPFEEGIVLAHEETFGGPKEDRLALMKATLANLSPVFGLYRDPAGTVAEALEAATGSAPDATANLDGVENRLWVVTDEKVIQSVVGAFANQNVYIADGHHRYTTALNFRDWVAEREGGSLLADHPAQFVLMAMADMDDPGSLILPTHRVLSELDDSQFERLLEAWREGCEETEESDADMTLYHGATGAARHVRFTNRGVLSSLEPDKSTSWCSLDVAYLHRYLIDELYVKTLGGRAQPKIRYVKQREDAERTAREEQGIALICKAATMDQLCAVSDTGDRMPQKSTFFYPKIATGLVINPLR